jgi:hypothetical protein
VGSGTLIVSCGYMLVPPKQIPAIFLAVWPRGDAMKELEKATVRIFESSNDSSNAMTAHQKPGEVIADDGQVAIVKDGVEVVPARSLSADLDRQLHVLEGDYGDAGACADDFLQARFSDSGPTFDLPGLRDPEVIEQFVGFIMHKQPIRVLWEGSGRKAKGTARPLCKSDDRIRGEGVPGGICAHCEKARWGQNDEPPACKERLHLYLYLPDKGMIIIDLPPGSLGDAERFIKEKRKLAPLHTLPVSISVTPVKGGMKEYPKAAFHVVGDPLAGEDAKAAAQLSGRLKQLLKLSNTIPAAPVILAPVDGEVV